jgi:hypothetical protein
MNLSKEEHEACSPCHRRLYYFHLAHLYTASKAKADLKAISEICDERAIDVHYDCPTESAYKNLKEPFTSINCSTG